MSQIATLKKTYTLPNIYKINIDNDISLSMESYVDPPIAPEEEDFAALQKSDYFSNDPFKSNIV